MERVWGGMASGVMKLTRTSSGNHEATCLSLWLAQWLKKTSETQRQESHGVE